MKDWKKTVIKLNTPIIEAMRIIDAGALQIALVVDEHYCLLGVITDGDIRRGLLTGVSLSLPVHTIMNKNFTAANVHAPHEEIFRLMKQNDLKQIPVIDESGCIVDLKIFSAMFQLLERDNWVVIMAGGLGTRLQPLTNDCPKPLLKVGDKPLLETIIDNFIESGFRKFFISINYKAEMIEAFLGDGARWGININYLRENMRMGTAGALSLLPQRPVDTFIVMNGDVLTRVNMQHLLDFHSFYKARATMCVQEYHLQFPYGVIGTDEHRIISINEKPSHRCFVNAGIYVLEPEVLDFIPQNSTFDMTTLFERLIMQGYETAAFPIREYWMDIGKIDDFERANGEYQLNFQKLQSEEDS